MRFNGRAAAQLLADRQISISEAARQTGVDRSHLSNVLSGRRNAGAEMVLLFSNFLQVEPMVLVGPSDPRAAVVSLAKLYKVRPEELVAS